MSLYFTSNIQEKEFNRKIAEMQQRIKTFGGTVRKEAGSMESAFNKFTSTLTAGVTAYGMQELARTIVNVRGEIQSLQLAYNTILGDAVKGRKLMQETIAFAAETPFDVLQVGQGTKQLLAYGSTAESVQGELRMLGDIAAGAKIPLGDLIYLYGTLRTQNRAMALDIRQFAGRGIPIYNELSKVLGVNVTEMNKMVSESKVFFSDVQKAFQNMTTEGGIFNNLMDQMSQTVSGRMSNLQDVITQMWNGIGTAQEGVIYSSIEGAHFLVENYETVIKTLVTLVAMYGSYKTATMAMIAIQRSQQTFTYTAEMAELSKLLALKNEELAVDLQKSVANKTLTLEQAEKITAMRAEVQAKLQNLQATSALAQADLKAAAAAENTAIRRAATAKAEYQMAIVRQNLGQQTLRQIMAEIPVNKLRIEEAEYQLVLAKMSKDAKQIEMAQVEVGIRQKQRDILLQQQSNTLQDLKIGKSKISTAQEKFATAQKTRLAAAQTLATAQQKANTAATAANTLQQNLNAVAVKAATKVQAFFTAATLRASAALKAARVAFLTNPMGVLITVLTTAATAWYLFKDGSEAAKTAMEEFNETQDETLNKSREFLSIIQSETATMYQKVEAYEALIQQSTALSNAYSLEQLLSGNVTEADIDRLLNKQRDADAYALLTGEVQKYTDALERERKTLSTTTDGDLVNSILSRIALYENQLAQAKQEVAAYDKLVQEAQKTENSLATNENIKLITDEKTALDVRAEAYEKLKNLSPELTKMYGEETLALMDLSQAQAALNKAEQVSILQKQQSALQGSLAALPKATSGVDVFASEREYLSKEIEKLRQAIVLELEKPLPETPTTPTELTKEQKAALEAEIKERQKVYLQGLRDYETFQQGVERLAKEHAERIAIYEVSVPKNSDGSPTKQGQSLLSQLTAGSANTMKEEIQVLKDSLVEESEIYQKWYDTLKEMELQQLEDTGASLRARLSLAKDLSIEETIIIQRQIDDVEEYRKKKATERLEQEKDALSALLKETATYEQRREAIIEEYRKKIASMYTGGEFDISTNSIVGGELKIGFTEGNAENLTKEYLIALQDLDVETAKTLGILGKLWGNFANISGKEIDIVIAEAEKLYALLNSNAVFTPQIGKDFDITSSMFESLKDVEELSAFRERLDELIEKADTAKSYFDGLAASWREMISSAQEDDLEGFGEALSALIEKAEAGLAIFDMFSETLAGIGVNTEGLEKVSDALSDTISGASSGAALGPWGAVAGAALGLVSSGFSAAAEVKAEHEKILVEIQQAQRNYEIAYDEFLRTVALEGDSNTQLFGTFDYDAAIRGIQVYRSELENLYSYTKGISEYALLKEQGFDASLGAEGLIEYTIALANAKRGLEDIQVITGSHTTGILWWKEQHDITDSILNQYPELIDAQGNFNAEIGRTILESATLSEENKQAFEDIVLAAEAAEEGLQQVRESLSSMFGDIGNSMGDAVADAVINGTDIALAALDELEVGLENFATRMAKSLAFQDIMQDASEEMLEAWKIEDPAKRNAAIMEIFNELAKDSKAAAEDQADIMEEWKQLAEENGLNIFEPEEEDRTGATASSGITATQDSVDEMSGKLTTMIYLGNQTVNALHAMTAFHSRVEQYHVAMLARVVNIDTTLTKVATSNETIKNSINDINIKGIKLKA